MDSVDPNCNAGDIQRRQVVEYYDLLAERYDDDRFGNSYGVYVNAQERRILERWLAPASGGKILDLACGTGRLLDLATHGLDASEAMVRATRSRHPDKSIHCGTVLELDKTGIQFDAIFCLHLFMHLPPGDIERLFRVCHNQLQPGGSFIFDVPTSLRRKLSGFRPTGWHGGTALSWTEVLNLAGASWVHRLQRGVLFSPIHRLPSRVRPLFRCIDDLLCMTPLKAISSYSLHCLTKT